ncbi:MAG: hypothetical protein P0Y59_21655 [Candidatus Sphingomonas phytovorans]|nr:hypothetical protein [Sphingomonas sp.]WEJ99487.1 MAG: hypothetical protein P0Y59_21655 [Sphingomonas sp.]
MRPNTFDGDDMYEEMEARPVPPAWKVLHRRWTRPNKQLSFWTFLLVGIVVLGGLAVWIEGYRYFNFVPTDKQSSADRAPLQLALATAGLAVAGPAAMQLLYSRDKLAIVTAILLFTVEMISAMYLMVFGVPKDCGTIVGGVTCVGIAIVAWVLANGEDDIFQDDVPNDVPAGGDPMRHLPGGPAPAKV